MLTTFALAVLASCGGGGDATSPHVPASIVALSSTNLTATAGTAVSPLPSVIVKDAKGNPVSGTTVTFAVASGGGTITGANQTTNAAGVATIGGWTLGTTAGSNTLTATAGSLSPVTFTATASAGAAAVVTKTAGDAQTATAGASVSVAPAVTVKDANGNAVSGVSVTFAVASGGGIVTGATQTTNASGVATLGSWTLGKTAGPNTLTATAGSLAAVTFTATGAVGPAAVVTKTAGDAQTARRSTLLPVNPAVTVTDANGNPVSGLTVTFAVASGGGSVSGASQTTDASGVATVGGWTLGATAGAQTLTAYAGSTLTATFTATAVDPCSTPTSYSVGTATTGQLESSDCSYTTGQFVDFFSSTLSASAQAYLFQQSSAGFDTYLTLYATDGTPIAENDNADGTTTNSSIKVFLPSGDYVLGASSHAAGAVGSYSLASSVTTADVANCETVYVVSGLTATQNITSSDCVDSSGPYYGDAYWIYLKAGQTLTVSMSSTAFDAYLTLYDASGAVKATNDNQASGTTDAQIVYTAPTAGYYQIFANTALPSQFGGYTLTIQ